MPEVNQDVLNKMLRNISDPKLRQNYSHIITGKFRFNIYCLSKDWSEEIEVPMLDEQGEQVYYKSGDHIGEPRRKKETIIHKGCDGRLVGYIADDGTVISEDKIDKETGEELSGIASSRDRFDGRKGFSCHCGNSSIIARQEEGVIVPRKIPTQEDLMEIANNLNRNPVLDGVAVNGLQEYDGFRIQENN